MNEINQARTVAGVTYLEKQWHVQQVRQSVTGEMRNLVAAWRALEEQAAQPGAVPGEISAEARRLVGDVLTAQRSVLGWLTGEPLPWVADGTDIVVGELRIPLDVELLADWAKGETA